MQEIVPGFAAAKQGQVQAEDVVIAVDNEPVEGWDLDAIKQLTIGDEHSLCTLLIKRGSQYLQASGRTARRGTVAGRHISSGGRRRGTTTDTDPHAAGASNQSAAGAARIRAGH